MKTTLSLLLFGLALAPLCASTIQSGDATGWNTFQPGASSSANSPNFALADAQSGLVLPPGVTPVSFGPTGAASFLQTMTFVDQWAAGQVSEIQWWSTGPTVIWLNGGLEGIVVNDLSAGPHSGTIDVSQLTEPFDYFAAFVTAQDSKIAFAYNGTNAPEPATWAMLLCGAVLLAWRKR